MPSDSKTASNLMSWGIKVAASQKSLYEAEPESFNKSEGGRYSKKGRGGGVFDGDLQQKCTDVAQQLVDETNELQYCEQILEDNEREFGARESELTQLLAEISRRLEEPRPKPVAEEVKLREEALWHLENTLKRLENEENVQGNALVALADCISCCQTVEERSKAISVDMALFIKKKLLTILQQLKEICVSYSSQSQDCIPYPDASLKIDIGQAIAERGSSKPLSSVLNDILNRFNYSCMQTRMLAGTSIIGLAKKSGELKAECDQQSFLVHHAHISIEELRKRSESILGEIVSVEEKERLLRERISRVSQTNLALEKEIDVVLTCCRSTENDNSTLEKEIHAICDETKYIKKTIDEHRFLQENIIETKGRLENELSRKQRTLEATDDGIFVSDSLREITRQIAEEEAEVDNLCRKIRNINEEETSLSLRAQGVHSDVLAETSLISESRSKENVLYESVNLLSKRQAECQSTLDSLRKEKMQHQHLLDCLDERQALVESQKQNEVKREFNLDNSINLLKQMLLSQSTQQRASDASSKAKLIARREPQLKQKSALVQHEARFTAKLENVVSTAPLTQLLLVDGKAPLKVVLDQRYNEDDEARARLMTAFHL